MKKCFRAPGRVIFLCNESGFCQRKEPARSEDRRAVSFQERGPARRAAPCARDPRSLRALIHSHSRLAGAPPRALTSGKAQKKSTLESHTEKLSRTQSRQKKEPENPVTQIFALWECGESLSLVIKINYVVTVISLILQVFNEIQLVKI
ncbi:PREDICTED: uncharacterized protein LOC106865098 [Sturnus vulgaris]|uniref:uncharacterized protein LOC106865098 n=1 Tax=Sturnus vulgaris TaxID=9172 RepID=UPI00071A9534|nr:PREDICTED: uncharacterized protein LOC106865098 [Sturnus vulgaris]